MNLLTWESCQAARHLCQKTSQEVEKEESAAWRAHCPSPCQLSLDFPCSGHWGDLGEQVVGVDDGEVEERQVAQLFGSWRRKRTWQRPPSLLLEWRADQGSGSGSQLGKVPREFWETGNVSFTSAREPAQNISHSMFSSQNNIAKAKSPVSCYKPLPLRVCECHSKLGPERNLLLNLLLVFNVHLFLWLLVNIHQVFSWVRPCGQWSINQFAFFDLHNTYLLKSVGRARAEQRKAKRMVV